MSASYYSIINYQKRAWTEISETCGLASSGMEKSVQEDGSWRYSYDWNTRDQVQDGLIGVENQVKKAAYITRTEGCLASRKIP
jgi:hypothetical protein